jgi:hypothetical protein
VRISLYLLSVVLALPCVLFALFVLTVEHVIVTRNVLKLLSHFLLAFGWGVPIAALAAILLLVAGFFPAGRVVGATLIVVLDVAALGIILISTARPKSFDESIFLIPSVASAALAGWLLVDHARSAAPAFQLESAPARTDANR